MNQTYQHDRYAGITKLVLVLLRIATVVLTVALAIVGILWIASWVLPQSVFEFDLALLDSIDVDLNNLQYNLSGLQLDGIVNLKRVAIVGLGVGVLNIGFLLYLLVLLKRVMTNVAAKNPFVKENVTYLRYMGLGYLIASVILSWANSLFLYQVVETLDLYDATVNFSMEIPSLFMGAILLIVAYVFDYGTYLQEEHDMTV
jgi:hypothetical protein